MDKRSHDAATASGEAKQSKKQKLAPQEEEEQEQEVYQDDEFPSSEHAPEEEENSQEEDEGAADDGDVIGSSVEEQEDPDPDESASIDKSADDNDEFPEEDESVESAPVVKPKRSTKKAPTHASEEEDAEESPTNFKLECTFCADAYKYPAVTCTNCDKYTLCEEDLRKWAMEKNGLTEKVPCPGCRSTKGFKENRVINDIIGHLEKSCINAKAGCTARVPVMDMELHLDKYCLFQTMSCAQKRHGCPWRGLRSEQKAHEKHCTFELVAKQQAELDARQTEFKRELAGLVEEIQQRRAELSLEVARCSNVITERIGKLRAQHEVLVEGCSRTFLALRRASEETMPLIWNKSTRATLPFVLHTVMLPGKYYQLWGSFKADKIPYPVFVAGYVMTLEKTAAGNLAMQQFALRFKTPAERFLLFDERIALGVPTDVNPEDDDVLIMLPSSADKIEFRIVCAVIK